MRIAPTVRPGVRLVAALGALAAVLAGVTSCSSSSATSSYSDGRIRVVAAENFWGDIAAQVGGSQVSVTSIITNPDTDPHLYQTDPQDAAEVGNAQLVIENGLGYDDFMSDMLATSSPSGRHVLSIQQVLGITGSDANPHVWYWTARMPKVAAAIADQLAAIDPGHAAYFRANAHHFDASLAPILHTIGEIKAKYAGTPVAYTERVPGYLVQAGGLVLGTPASFSMALEDGNDPSPQDAATFDADITGHKVAVLLYNSQVVDAQTTRIKDLAEQAHVPVVGVSETMPPGETYQTWQQRQDRAVLEALRG